MTEKAKSIPDGFYTFTTSLATHKLDLSIKKIKKTGEMFFPNMFGK